MSNCSNQKPSEQITVRDMPPLQTELVTIAREAGAALRHSANCEKAIANVMDILGIEPKGKGETPVPSVALSDDEREAVVKPFLILAHQRAAIDEAVDRFLDRLETFSKLEAIRNHLHDIPKPMSQR